jgi:chemotaxis protein histidine kinase CheA
VEQEFSDLVPVFVEEARERLDRLATLVPRLPGDPEAVVATRRELHTLKGSSRMLGLGALAELCHAAEDALAEGHPELAALLTRTIDRLAAMVATVGAGGEPAPAPELVAALRGPAAVPPPGAATPSAGRGAAEPAAPPAAPLPGDVRVAAAALDEVADRATQLRLMALGAGRVGERAAELARLAEEGRREPQPAQLLAVLAAMLRRMAVEIDGEQRLMLRAAEEQLERVLTLQLQPLRGILLSLARHARQTAAALGREVEVELAGEETRLDRRIARDLEDALLHLVHNAVDHGLEAPEERRRLGKPAAGHLTLAASGAGSRVRLEIRDDGPGVDVEAVSRRAVAAGLLAADAAAALTPEEASRLLFRPGFSTRPEVSELSGRGVGLDVVAAAVARVGGEVTLASRPAEGTAVTLEVPVARRGEQVLVVRVGEVWMALPAAAVRSVAPLPAASVAEGADGPVARRDGRRVPFVPLARWWGETPAEPQMLLEGEVSGQPVALAVDDVVGEEEVLVRPLPRAVAVGDLLEGVALLASGRPVGVLSPLALARRDGGARPPAVPPPVVRRVRVLLVEDSLVTREMERRLLEDAGFAVVAAAAADEALGHLAGEAFDCVVTDIEMPGMDGFALTAHLRARDDLAHLPIVVVSTRDRPEDRLRGLRAGADAYLTKQGLDAGELVDLVRRLAGR